MANKYTQKKYQLGLALQTTKSHPFGKGADKKTAEELVQIADEKGISPKKAAKKFQALKNLTHKQVFGHAARLERGIAHEEGLYKEDKRLRG